MFDNNSANKLKVFVKNIFFSMQLASLMKCLQLLTVRALVELTLFNKTDCGLFNKTTKLISIKLPAIAFLWLQPFGLEPESSASRSKNWFLLGPQLRQHGNEFFFVEHDCSCKLKATSKRYFDLATQVGLHLFWKTKLSMTASRQPRLYCTAPASSRFFQTDLGKQYVKKLVWSELKLPSLGSLRSGHAAIIPVSLSS